MNPPEQRAALRTIRCLFAYNEACPQRILASQASKLTLTGHNLGDMVILRCADRIVRGEETAILCAGAQQQGRNVILDLEWG